MRIFLGLFLIMITSFTTSFKNGFNKLGPEFSEKDKQNVKLFQASRNSNRSAIYEQLLPLIRTKANNKQVFLKMNMLSIANYQTIKNVLGEPDFKLKNNILIYTLNPTNGCKAYIELDENALVNYCITKDCMK